MSYRDTWLEINLDHLSNNIHYLANNSKKKVFAVIKANAYGLGAYQIAKTAIEAGVTYLAVSSLDEALSLRKQGINHPILVFGVVNVNLAPIAVKYNITLSVNDLNWAKQLAAASIPPLSLHFKVDTGMHRVGFLSLADLKAAINLLQSKHHLEGIYTHYAKADNFNETVKQFEQFKNMVKATEYHFKWIHSSNSIAALTFKEDFTNAIRPGLALYGYADNHHLKEVVQLFTKISFIKELPANASIGYDGIYTTSEHSIIATLPIGYADGISTTYTGHNVYINKQLHPIVGKICMDQTMVKLNTPCQVGDTVEIFGNHISIDDYCQASNLIPYQALCLLQPRISRKYIKDGLTINECNYILMEDKNND